MSTNMLSWAVLPIMAVVCWFSLRMAIKGVSSGRGFLLAVGLLVVNVVGLVYASWSLAHHLGFL